VKPLGVPLVALAGWIMFSWLAWALARLIMRLGASVAVGGAERFTTPIVATFILGAMTSSTMPSGRRHTTGTPTTTRGARWVFH
jgi:hypothetical protein